MNNIFQAVEQIKVVDTQAEEFLSTYVFSTREIESYHLLLERFNKLSIGEIAVLEHVENLRNGTIVEAAKEFRSVKFFNDSKFCVIAGDDSELVDRAAEYLSGQGMVSSSLGHVDIMDYYSKKAAESKFDMGVHGDYVRGTTLYKILSELSVMDLDPFTFSGVKPEFVSDDKAESFDSHEFNAPKNMFLKILLDENVQQALKKCINISKTTTGKLFFREWDKLVEYARKSDFVISGVNHESIRGVFDIFEFLKHEIIMMEVCKYMRDSRCPFTLNVEDRKHFYLKNINNAGILPHSKNLKSINNLEGLRSYFSHKIWFIIDQNYQNTYEFIFYVLNAQTDIDAFNFLDSEFTEADITLEPLTENWGSNLMLSTYDLLKDNIINIAESIIDKKLK